ncbi:DNA repair protein RadC, partial [mine drainage metagenome]
ITAARACVAKRMRRGASLTSPKAARDYLVLRFAELQHEVFCVIYLDSRHA